MMTFITNKVIPGPETTYIFFISFNLSIHVYIINFGGHLRKMIPHVLMIRIIYFKILLKIIIL